MEYEKLADEAVGEPSEQVRQRVEKARARQQERFAGTRLVCNAEMTPLEVREYCQDALEDGAKSLLRLAMNQLALSARSFHRVLKLARTVADLAGSEGITTPHVAEALQYRQRGSG